MADAQIGTVATILGTSAINLAAVIALFIFAMRQQNKAEDRQVTERHESERRLTEQIAASEKRLTEQIAASEKRLTDLIKAVDEHSNKRLEDSERRLTELYREVNRDTKTLIGEVGFIRGSLGISPSRQGTDPDGAAEVAD